MNTETLGSCAACGRTNVQDRTGLVFCPICSEPNNLAQIVAEPKGTVCPACEAERFCPTCGWEICKCKSQPDMVNHPPHYTSHPSGVECIQVTEHMSFCIGNAIKYLWRSDEKGSAVEDLEKARWYITREIERKKKQAS